MKKILGITLITLMLLCLLGCSQKEPSVAAPYEATDPETAFASDEFVTVVKTYEITDTETAFDNDEPVTMVKYYEMSDGTWKTDDYAYQYRLEITGRMSSAAKDTTFVFLSNIEDITFEQAWKASGLSSNMNDYFNPEDAKLVALG